jgi:hypothetical protein
LSSAITAVAAATSDEVPELAVPPPEVVADVQPAAKSNASETPITGVIADNFLTLASPMAPDAMSELASILYTYVYYFGLAKSRHIWDVMPYA